MLIVVIVVAVMNYTAMSLPDNVSLKLRRIGLVCGLVGLFMLVMIVAWPLLVVIHFASDDWVGVARMFWPLVVMAGICTAGSTAIVISTSFRNEGRSHPKR